ncbi:butyrophilin subfamily 1 member A1-like [Xiphophorus maculatus]|uniref:butyrophilin subfamily 1 member A1-like n=1 Tax=Xiphophorus maculatus TaxID=8083 RepID=UPI000C6E39FA|nr:butyrophilin subfamily 1 member A1-like [Xiphophorus maculatus]XP_023202867.1 butyrophilin subfamily 1 member A1-like [Xiphophorus maculatus]
MFSDMTFTCSSSIRVWATNPGCLLFLFVLSGSASADIVPQTITAYVTEIVVLPCHITVDGELPTVEWSKEGLRENSITLLYRDGCETFGMKNPAFHYRTNLLLNKLKDGNISQIIYNLRVSDGGKYNCRTLRGKEWQVHAIIVLNVGATSKPELTVVPSTEGGELTLECKAECWFPEPDITFYDDERNEIPAEKPTRGPNSRECFTVTRRAVVQTKINRVTCKVHERKFNQTKNTEIYIPDGWMRSCSNTAIITGIVTSFVTGLIICGIVFLGDKKSCGRGQHSRNGGMKEAVQEKEEAERNGYRYRGTSQEEQSTDDSMISPDGTGPIAQTPSYNVATGQDTSTMKTSQMTVVRRNKTLSLLSNDRPRSMSSSPSSLFPPSTIISRANTNESSETLLNEQGNHNN